MKSVIDNQIRKNMKQLILNVLLVFLPLLCSAQPPDTLGQEVNIVHLDTSGIELSNPFNLQIQRVEKTNETKKLSVKWKKKMPYWFASIAFQKKGLLFSANFLDRIPEDSNPFVIDLETGKNVYLGDKKWESVIQDYHHSYICYHSKKDDYILADFKTNRVVKRFSEFPPREDYIFFPKDVVLTKEKVGRKGRERGYDIIHAYNIKKDSVLWSKDEVHKRIIGYEDGELLREELGDYNYIKDWRETEDYLIIDGKFPGSPRRLYFFDKYSFTIKKAYPNPDKYYYKFRGDTLYWFIQSNDKVERMYAVDYNNDKIHWGIKRKTMKLNIKGDYLVFDDKDPGIFFVNRKTGEPVKRIHTTEDFHLSSFDYFNGNIISTVSSKDYMPRMSKDIEGYYDVLIDVSTLRQYKLEELSDNLCEECIQPEYPVDCVNQLKYLDITYKDYIYAELKCGDFYYLLCMKIEDQE